MKRKTNAWLIVLAVSLAVLFFMSVISNALTIGEKLGETYPWMTWVYYGLIIFVIAFGIVYPIFGVFTRPIFALKDLHTADGKAKQKWCKRLVNNLLKNVELTPDERITVKGFLNEGDETDDRLILFFDSKIRPEINAEIKDTAKKVFLITAISQNSVYDMLGMASANFSLVKRIVEICGFRPTTPQLIKLYIKVLSYSLVSGGLEDMNIEEMVPMVAESTLGKLGGVFLASATQGAWNALASIRIAVITKNYLLNADVSQTKKELRKKSFKEAGELLKDIVSEGVEHKVAEPIKNFFKKSKNETVEE
ncbi:MAG: DUF697 domain-containing protein [Lachnospiraceae bacterium]|nr:DUF697 domain-containing protein [Lachnospiraceae bacterium]